MKKNTPLLFSIFCVFSPFLLFGQMPNIGLLANINPTAAAGSSPSNMIKLGSIVLFSANDGTNGTELWKSDGTTAGTVLVKDIRSGGSSSPNNFVLLGSYVYFTANDGVNGGALWRSDGTTAGTTLVKDINTTSTTSSPFIWQLTAIGSKLYFRADDGTNGEEPWISDGTAAGTTMLKHIRAGSDGSSNEGANSTGCFGTYEFVEFNGFVYFNANDGANGGQNSELWRTDGTTAGTALFIDNYCCGGGGPGNLVNAGTFLFFTSDNQSLTGVEPWKSDGTVGGTTMIKNIFNPGFNAGSILGDVPTAYMNGYVYFVAIDVYYPANNSLMPPQSAYINAELWRTDGTDANTTKVKEINPSTTGTNADAFPNNFSTFYVFNNKLYFTATDGTNGTEAWVTDGTSANTIMLANIDAAGSSSPSEFFAFNGFVYFSADDNAANGRELWRTDGTAGNTALVKDINAGASNGSPADMVLLDANHVLFRATYAVTGSELFIMGGYKIAVTTGANGITTLPGAGSAGSTLDVGAKSGSNLTFTFTPDPTYSVQSLTVDGAGAGGGSSYTFNNVTANHTLSVAFGTGPPSCPTIIFTATPTNACPSSSNGQIVVSNVNGGAAPYMYSKDNGANYGSSATFTGLAAGNYTVAVKDANGCFSTNLVGVGNTDNQPPTITCPGNATVNANASCQGQIGSYTAATLNDNCNPTPVVTQSPPSTTTLTGHNTAQTVTLTANDGNGNTSTCTLTVTLKDVTPPSITCPANATVAANASCQGTVGSRTAATLSDNCNPTPVVTQSPSSTTTLTGHNTAQTVTLTANDGNSNTNTCTFTVTLKDNTPPNITCPANATVAANASCAGTIGVYTAATLSDNCNPTPVVTQSPPSTTTLTGHNAAQTVTLTANDGNGNTNTCTFTVTLKDNTPPNITCPGNATVNANASCQGQIGAYTAATLGDNCNPTPVVTQSPPSTTTLTGHNSTQTVTLTANDGNGNTSTCTLTVTLKDVTQPNITCPANVTIAADATCEGMVGTYTAATLSDNCNPTPVVTQNPTPTTNLSGHNDMQTVTLMANDNNGNTRTCTFTVTLKDVTPPSITCPNPVTVQANAGCQGQVGSYSASSMSDNCSTNPSVTQSPVSSTLLTGHNATQTVTLTANDGNGNTNTCTFIVTLKDVTPPSIVCPANATVQANASCQGQIGSYNAILLSDNCNPTPVVTQSPVSSTLLTGHNAAQTVTLTASDGNGNTNTCTLTVTLKDVTPPNISCPGNITVGVDGSCGGVLGIYGPTLLNDNCNATPSVTQSPTASTVVSGHNTTQTVTLTANDGNGNTSTCTFGVTLRDVTPPTITCPGNIVRSNDPGSCVAVVTYPLPVANDNCSGVGLGHLSGGLSGSTFNAGATVITWMATDASNLTATCSFTVTVSDTELPSITCPPNLARNTDPGVCSAVVTYATPTASDNCTLPVGQPMWVSGGTGHVSGSPNSSATFPKGTTIVQWKATDGAGQTKTCTFRVIVNDMESPSMTCPSPINTNAGATACSAVVTYSNPTFTDNCPPTTGTSVRTSGLPSGSAFPVGSSTVIFRATDAAGRTSTCSLQVTVTDTQLPIINCPGNVTVAGSGTPCQATAFYALATASDNCDGPLTPFLVSGLGSGSNFPAGVTTNTWRAIATNGQSSDCSFTVTVNCPPSAPTEVAARNRPNGAFEPHQNALKADLSLVPNPAVSELTIAVGGLSSKGGNLSMLDALGRTVWQYALGAEQTQTTLQGLESWSKGVYIVVLHTDGQVVTKKVVLQ